jgi:RNA recognition motif-containing protein
MGWRLILTVRAGEAVTMEVKLYVGNLPKATTQEELNTLFNRAGDVTSVDLIMDRERGGSKGFAYITMSAQSEADRAVSMFDSYFLATQPLRVKLTKARELRGFA